MGEKQPSIRTLDTGEKVTHYPSGEQVMVPGNALADQFETDVDLRRWLDAEKTYGRLQAVEEKRAAQQAGDAVPSDKSPL